DLAGALERVTRYVAERSAETPKVEPLRPEWAQNGHNRPSDAFAENDSANATRSNPEWRRAESNRGPRDYEPEEARWQRRGLTRRIKANVRSVVDLGCAAVHGRSRPFRSVS